MAAAGKLRIRIAGFAGLDFRTASQIVISRTQITPSGRKSNRAAPRSPFRARSIMREPKPVRLGGSTVGPPASCQDSFIRREDEASRSEEHTSELQSLMRH